MKHRLVKSILWILVLSPAVFVFFAIQYSAITAPFMDHVERTLTRQNLSRGFPLP
jgi:hypothetical protein